MVDINAKLRAVLDKFETEYWGKSNENIYIEILDGISNLLHMVADSYDDFEIVPDLVDFYETAVAFEHFSTEFTGDEHRSLLSAFGGTIDDYYHNRKSVSAQNSTSGEETITDELGTHPAESHPIRVGAEGFVLGPEPTAGEESGQVVELDATTEPDEALPETPAQGEARITGTGVVRDTVEPASDAATAKVADRTARTIFAVDPDDRIRLSEPDAIPAARVVVQRDQSREKLKDLLDALDGLYGEDAPEDERQGNKKEVSLTQDALELLRTTVSTALVIHESRSFSPRITGILRELREILIEAEATLKQAKKSSVAFKELIEQFGYVILALGILIKTLSGN